jgi:hypothetical protein
MADNKLFLDAIHCIETQIIIWANEILPENPKWRQNSKWRQKSKKSYFFCQMANFNGFQKKICVLFVLLVSIKWRWVGRFRIQDGGTNRINRFFVKKSTFTKPSISMTMQHISLNGNRWNFAPFPRKIPKDLSSEPKNL